MIDKFIAGRYYRCTAKYRQQNWNPSGKMDAVLDGKPRQVLRTIFYTSASFIDTGGVDKLWTWELPLWTEQLPDMIIDEDGSIKQGTDYDKDASR